MKKLLSIVWILLISWNLQAQEGEGGMWIPPEIEMMVPDMQKMGMQMTAEDIWSNDKPSLRDAVIQLGNGCTGEFVSDKGLVFTNHHCGYDAIASVSTTEHNYLRDGFWAKSFEEEIPVDLSIYIINEFKDVTDIILKDVPETGDPAQRQSMIDKNIAAYLKQFPKEKFVHRQVKPFFKGNKYYLIVKTEYPDVRLVGTPPESIGKFGGDTDNWMWPRHTGDFSIFRVYAGPDNKPAEYSKKNVPFKPARYLKISLAGVAPDDFTLIMGFPGSTNEYLTSYAVKQIQDLRDPARVGVREKSLNVMSEYMKKSEELKLKLSSKFAGLANYWKFWIGESKGLKKFKAVEAKQAYEKEFTKRINRNEVWKRKYGDVLPRLKKLYLEIEKYRVAADVHREVFYRNIDATLNYAILKGLYRVAKADKKQYQALYKRYKDYLLNDLMKNYVKEVDRDIFVLLMKHYLEVIPGEFIHPEFKKALEEKGVEAVADEIYNKSFLADSEKLEKVLSKNPKKFIQAFENDPGVRLISLQDDFFNMKVMKPMHALQAQINEWMRLYMKAQMEVFPEKKFFPDANSTMRVSYGRVRGYRPRDAVYYKPFTHLYGVMEKYIPGDPEFDVPPKLISLYEKRDYGPYKNIDGTMVVDFLATNHITGGNSGSPTVDAYGNLIGLAFDGVWEGVMEDIYYRPEVARSIIVDIRYVLFIIDKYGNAKRIIDELDIIKKKPKTKLKKKDVKRVPAPQMN